MYCVYRLYTPPLSRHLFNFNAALNFRSMFLKEALFCFGSKSKFKVKFKTFLDDRQHFQPYYFTVLFIKLAVHIKIPYKIACTRFAAYSTLFF